MPAEEAVKEKKRPAPVFVEQKPETDSIREIATELVKGRLVTGTVSPQRREKLERILVSKLASRPAAPQVAHEKSGYSQKVPKINGEADAQLNWKVGVQQNYSFA